MKVEINISDSSLIHALKQLSTVLGFKEYRLNVESDTAIIAYPEDNNFGVTPHVCKCGEECHKEHAHEEIAPPTVVEQELDLQVDPVEEVFPVSKEDEHDSVSKVNEAVSTNKKTVLTSAKCPICGKEFTRKVSNQTYCSIQCKRTEDNRRRRACRNSSKRKRLGLKGTYVPEKRECPVCHKEFVQQRPNQKYCSHKCKRVLDIQRVLKLRAEKDAQKTSAKYEKSRQSAVTVSNSVANVVKRQSTSAKLPDPTPVKIENDRPVFNFRCKLCDNLFQTTHKDQHFCNPCMDAFGVEQCEQLVIEENQKKRMIEEAGKIRFKVCPKCGHTFEAKNPVAEFFCPKCVERAQRVPLLNK